jgi:hypothetical protein
MALPEYAFSDDDVLTPDDLTPEVMEAFDRHCAGTEGSVFSGAFTSRDPRALVRTKSPYDEAGDYTDAALFRDAFR